MSASTASSPLSSSHLSNSLTGWPEQDSHPTSTSSLHHHHHHHHHNHGLGMGMENSFSLDYSWTSASDADNTPNSNPFDSAPLSTINLSSWASPATSGKDIGSPFNAANSPTLGQILSNDVQDLPESESEDDGSSSGGSSSNKRESEEGQASTSKRKASRKSNANGQRSSKGKVQRRQGVTCDQCRSKHIRCIAPPSTSSSPADSDLSGKSNIGGRKRCTRCIEKGLECTRNHAPPSRRYPRPSRTGKRIEQARLMHGSIEGAQAASAAARIDANTSDLNILGQTGGFPVGMHAFPISIPHQSNNHLQQHVIAGSTSLRLLTCFFASAHMQLPIVDFHNFSARYNFSQGNSRIMSVMANGGDETQRIPSARQSAPGLRMSCWPPTNGTSTLATPGTTETLIAAMHAWAAVYTDLPIAFGTNAGLLELSRRDEDQSGSSNGKMSLPQNQPKHTSHDAVVDDAAAFGEEPPMVMGANGKLRRPKRKQGVACDTCRLRRLRCDKLERPEGMGCSRCEDKRIVCTDEYIQTKRAKSMAAAAAAAAKKSQQSDTTPSSSESQTIPLSNTSSTQGDKRSSDGNLTSSEETDVISSARNLHAQDLPRGSGPNSWDGSSHEQRAWIDDGPRLPKNYTFGRGREMIAYGKARQAFVHLMLERGLNLAYRHDLLKMPSIEAIQALLILSQVCSLVRRDDAATELAEAVNSHLNILGLESNDEVDEQDKIAVELILSQLQRKRLWCCVWGRDALVSGLFRSVPAFDAERAIGIKGNQSQRSANPQGERINTQLNNSAILTGANDGKTSQIPSSNGKLELNGQMGLSFSILALLQVGALARFMNKHIDNISHSRPAIYLGPGTGLASRQAPPDRFPMMPTPLEMRKLQRACFALWRSIDSLLLFFDECALKARENMASLHPFQPLGWIATLKITAAMLDLSTYRIIGERIHLARTYMQATATLSNNGVGGDIGGVMGMQEMMMEQMTQLEALRSASQKRCWTSCRRIALMIEFLLSKNVFQTGGLLMRSIVHIASFLVHQPAAPTATLTTLSDEGQQINPILGLHEPASEQDQSTTQQSIDPRSIFGTGNTANSSPTPTLSNQSNTDSAKGHIPEYVFTGQLPPFDATRKYHEVQLCLEAMAQMGYAWSGIDQEISQIQQALQFASM